MKRVYHKKIFKNIYFRVYFRPTWWYDIVLFHIAFFKNYWSKKIVVLNFNLCILNIDLRLEIKIKNKYKK